VRKLRIAGAALAGGAAIAGQLALAQDGGPGPRLTFGVSQTFDSNDNLDLDVDSAGSSFQSLTGLSFGLSSETGLSSLDFEASTALRYLDGPDAGGEFDLDGTLIGLAYDRATPAAALSVDGAYTMDQIDGGVTLADFAGTGAQVPEDFSALSGTGMRRFYALDAGLSLGLDDPVGYELTAGVSGLSYSDTTDPGLFGNTRSEVGAALLLQLSPVTQARAGLSYGDFSSDDPDNEGSTNTGLDLGLTRDLPNGSAGIDIFVADYSDNSDSRAGFLLSGAMDLPAGALEASIGATQLEGESAVLTGGIAWEQALPRGAVNLALDRDVQNDSDDVPQYVTGLRLGYQQTLDPLSQLGLSATYALTEDAGSPDQTEAASFSAVYSRAVTPDWSLDLGYTYQQRDENAAGTARSNSVFVGLSRTWEMRP
jgi:hypothetical protein